MKLYKVFIHNKGFYGEDLMINPKDFPNLRKGDIVEIHHPEDEYSRLLLQITAFKDDMQGRDAISVEQSVATTFQLRTYADVIVTPVNADSVGLDSIEVAFKDQYMGRSEMWRLKNSLVGTCVYLHKKIEFCGGSVRCQVYEMWSRGDRVACGVITETTKIVFRSSTSMVYLFIQMSSEMWDFDIHGDLYFEKAVNGFLTELFQKWKNHGSNHEVTIVFFSRTFYLAQSVEEFPSHMKDCLQKDYKGRFYEDFYRVAVQNERYEDWSPLLIELKKIFSDYQRCVLENHCSSDSTMPKAVNSTAAQGNFLEVLNMSLNVFEKHYLDRGFDRTGQLVVVITPGVGVFEVDRELTNATKQRIIDNGVGSDLVCLGEQPLHAVPLFKFHNKESTIMGDDYSMPHWINLSFFSSEKRVAYSNFAPRIKLPPKVAHSRQSVGLRQVTRSKALPEEDDNTSSTVIEFDAYDSQVFSIPHSQSSKISRPQKKTSVAGIESLVCRSLRRKLSDPDIHFGSDHMCSSIGSLSKSPAIEIPPRSRNDMNSSLMSSTVQSDSTYRRSGAGILGSETESPPSRLAVGSSGSGGPQFQLGNFQAPRPGRALINPFDLSHISAKLTSSRRRWTHIFPKGPTGNLIQHHHYQRNSFQNYESFSDLPLSDGTGKGRSSFSTLPSLTDSQSSAKRSALLWGVTGEQEWSSTLSTVSRVAIGVDWKSLTIPACLPITTDYFPDEICLRSDYVFSDYNLLPDAVNADYARQRIVYRKPLLTREVFQELISQRLAQGFQLIVDGGSSSHLSISGQPGCVVAGSRGKEGNNTIEFKLSIGRIFHRISLNGSEIRVTRYRPRHPYPSFNFHYWYQLQAPEHKNYTVSWVSFCTEKLENFNWNYFDHYICTRGDADFALLESLKYWRLRLFILPACQSATKKILDGSFHCNVYNHTTADEQQSLIDNFLKYVETWINKIKRQQTQSKSRQDLSGLNVPNLLNQRRYSTGIIFLKSNVGGNSPFRERLGSNRLPEKPRPRSGSKVFERSSKASQSMDCSIPSTTDTDHTENEQEGAQNFVLKAGCDYHEIFEQMKNPSMGIGFVSPAPSLPKYTFVSADAVQWLMNRVEGVKEEQALTILQGMLKEKLICHASGDSSRRFIHGFYLYHLRYGREELKDGETMPIGDLSGFENEWMEVELARDPRRLGKPHFLLKDLPEPINETGSTYKQSHLEMDGQSKSDRVEWGHIKYHSSYTPTKAFEIVVQWAAASGAIVADLIFGWARKAQSCGLQMVPVPAVPFALPCSLKSDSLRGPVFVPVDTESIMDNRSYLFEEFEESSRNRRLCLFLGAIAIKFGFIRCSMEEASSQQDHYVHLSGNAFLLIPTQPCEHSASPHGLNQLPKCGTSPEPSISPHSDFVSQRVGNHIYNHELRPGFLWYRNHMVNRRWKLGPTSVTSDESFQSKLFSDFKAFCRNDEGRLVGFWHHCKEVS